MLHFFRNERSVENSSPRDMSNETVQYVDLTSFLPHTLLRMIHQPSVIDVLSISSQCLPHLSHVPTMCHPCLSHVSAISQSCLGNVSAMSHHVVGSRSVTTHRRSVAKQHLAHVAAPYRKPITRGETRPHASKCDIGTFPHCVLSFLGLK